MIERNPLKVEPHLQTLVLLRNTFYERRLTVMTQSLSLRTTQADEWHWTPGPIEGDQGNEGEGVRDSNIAIRVCILAEKGLSAELIVIGTEKRLGVGGVGPWARDPHLYGFPWARDPHLYMGFPGPA